MIIIGIKGFIGAGKTTLAQHLIEQHGFVRGRFAGALKDMLRAFLRYRGCDERSIDRMVDGDLKEVPSQYLGGQSPRVAMEALGTTWGRDAIHPDLWVQAESDRLYINRPDRELFEDVRYPNEAAAIRENGGRIWEVWQPGLVPKDLPTEIAQRQIEADNVIVNYVGKLDHTREQADVLLALTLGGAAPPPFTFGLPPMQEQPNRPSPECPDCWKDEKPDSRTRYVCTGRCKQAELLDLMPFAALGAPIVGEGGR